MSRPTVCLNMIVKDEAHVIERCLASVRPFIDHWVIVDTGSSDDTREIIRAALADLPGELHERPWKDFGHNRSEALELARDKADYALIIDADEVLEADEGFELGELGADAYMTLHDAGKGTRFYLNQLVRSALPWRYVGVLHEVITCDEPHRIEKLEGIVCKGFFDSARNKDPKAKYAADAKVLEKAVEQAPDNARYVFYLAQSYRDAGMLEPAIETYTRRADMGGWDEEVWYARYQVAVLLHRSGDFDRAVPAYLQAYQLRPTRAEAVYALAYAYRKRRQYHLAYLFAREAAAIPRPDDILFMDETVYRWRAEDELAVCTYWVGLYGESLALFDELLASGRLPDDEVARVENNRGYAVKKLEQVSATRPTAKSHLEDQRRNRNKRKGKYRSRKRR